MCRRTGGDEEQWNRGSEKRRWGWRGGVRGGDGRLTTKLENSPALLGSRNYAQLELHLKHVQVYAASPPAVFSTPMAALASVCVCVCAFTTTLIPEVTSAV